MELFRASILLKRSSIHHDKDEKIDRSLLAETNAWSLSLQWKYNWMMRGVILTWKSKVFLCFLSLLLPSIIQVLLLWIFAQKTKQ